VWICSFDSSYWKHCLYSIILPLLFCQRSFDHINFSPFLSPLVCFIDLCLFPQIFSSILSPELHCLDYCCFILSDGIRLSESPNFFLLLQGCMDYWVCYFTFPIWKARADWSWEFSFLKIGKALIIPSKTGLRTKCYYIFQTDSFSFASARRPRGLFSVSWTPMNLINHLEVNLRIFGVLPWLEILSFKVVHTKSPSSYSSDIPIMALVPEVVHLRVCTC
jgi:hypothetical protein